MDPHARPSAARYNQESNRRTLRFDSLRQRSSECPSPQTSSPNNWPNCGGTSRRLRKDALDQIQKIGESFDAHLWRSDEKFTSDLNDLKVEATAGREALSMQVHSLREGFAESQTRTETLLAIGNRSFGLLLAVFLTLVGTIVGAIWGASRVYHDVEIHSERIERLERSLDHVPKLQESIDRLQKTLEAQSQPADR